MKAFQDTYLFSSLSIEELQELKEKSSIVSYEKGELIYKTGSFNTHAFYLVEGYAKIYLDTPKTKQIVKLSKPGWFVGLMSIFAYDKHHFSASAITDCQLRSIPRALLQTYVWNNPEFASKLLKEISLLGTNVSHFLVSKNSKNMRGKIASILLHLRSDIYQKDTFKMNFTRKELGDLASTSTETAIRILAEFKKEKAIESKGDNIRILDADKLEKIRSLG
jgi:CRP-like cAMP-binding protein